MEQQNDFITDTELKSVVIVKRPTFTDERGFFRETFRKADLGNRLGFAFEPVQANHSRSQKDTLRGIHIAPWHKLITVMRGQVQQVVVDLREDSQTFGKYISVIVGEDNWCSIFLPAYCGNAFLVLSDIADYNYLATDYWAPGQEKYAIYNDPDINIAWQSNNPIVSEKDLQSPSIRVLFPNKFV